jgi:hypothetical protein
MRREGVVDDLGAVQLNAGAVRHAPVQRAVARRIEGLGDAAGAELGTHGGAW